MKLSYLLAVFFLITTIKLKATPHQSTSKKKELISEKIENKQSYKKLKWSDKLLLKIAKKRSEKLARKRLTNQEEKNPFSILSFIFSLIAIIGVYSIQSFPLFFIGAPLAIVLGIIGLRRNRRHRGFGILGIGIGAFTLLAILSFIFFF